MVVESTEKYDGCSHLVVSVHSGYDRNRNHVVDGDRDNRSHSYHCRNHDRGRRNRNDCCGADGRSHNPSRDRRRMMDNDGNFHIGSLDLENSNLDSRLGRGRIREV